MNILMVEKERDEIELYRNRNTIHTVFWEIFGHVGRIFYRLFSL